MKPVRVTKGLATMGARGSTLMLLRTLPRLRLTLPRGTAAQSRLDSALLLGGAGLDGLAATLRFHFGARTRARSAGRRLHPHPFFPVISITDDLAQTPILAEGNKLQDALKAPELRHFAQLPVVATLAQVVLLTARVTLWRDMEARAIFLQAWSWNPNIEKRPPPETL